MKTDDVSRRDFLKTTAMTGAAVAGLSQIAPAAISEKKEEPVPQCDAVIVTDCKPGDKIWVYTPDRSDLSSLLLEVIIPPQAPGEYGPISRGIDLPAAWGKVHIYCHRKRIESIYGCTGVDAPWTRTDYRVCSGWEVDHGRRPPGPLYRLSSHWEFLATYSGGILNLTAGLGMQVS